MEYLVYINAEKQTVERLPFPSHGEDGLDYKYLQGLVDGLITMQRIDSKNDMVLNDEGALFDQNYLFKLAGVGQEIFCGNAVLVGVNDLGETVGTCITVDHVLERITWLGLQCPEDFIDTTPRIVFLE